MDKYADDRESVFEKLRIDEESLARRGILPNDAKAGILAIATRRAALSGRREVHDVDLQITAWLLCFLPNWPKAEAYERYIRNVAPKLLAGASVDDRVREQASRFFPDQVLRVEPMQISVWLARRERRLGVDAFLPERFEWPPSFKL
jgi:hypothetical protein